MKRLALILLLVLFLFYTMGHIACLYLMQFEHKQSMQRKIASGNYTEAKLVKVPSTKLNEVAYLNDDEILFEDHMYDVIRSYEKDGDIYFVCLSDEEESSIIYAMRDYSEEAGAKSKSLQGSLLKLVNSVFSCNATDLFVTSEMFLVNNYLPANSPKTISLPEELDSPPPDRVSFIFS